MRQEPLFLTSQILCEFYSIVTDLRPVPKPRSTADALAAISGLLAFLHVLPIPAHTMKGHSPDFALAGNGVA